MIEADISMGNLYNGRSNIPIMAHPPNNTSDISLEEFFNHIMAYNLDNSNKMKGVKLDFKSTDAFEKSLDILDKMFGKVNKILIILLVYNLF